jgi:hypothetical protein
MTKLNPLFAIVRKRLEAAKVCDGLELRWDVELARDVAASLKTYKSLKT